MKLLMHSGCETVKPTHNELNPFRYRRKLYAIQSIFVIRFRCNVYVLDNNHIIKELHYKAAQQCQLF